MKRSPRLGEDKRAAPLKHRKGASVPGAPYGMTATLQDRVNADLLAFIRS
jgi:non-heme chloroperoxidase